MADAASSLVFMALVEEQRTQLEKRAGSVRAFIEDLLKRKEFAIHAVTTRVKSAKSLRSKIRLKGYTDPSAEMTDMIGIRVILYYEDHVELAAQAIKEKIQWSAEHSKDKRKHLGTSEFGYRSVHIVAELPDFAKMEADETLAVSSFEVQVRSLLEHVWAEIEHEVKYKSGIKFPEPTSRRFSALAGSLEILDREFVNVREAQNDVVQEHLARYEAGNDGSETLDSARLIAAFRAHFPEAPGWLRQLGSLSWYDFPDANAYLQALQRVGMTTWNAIAASLERREIIRGVEEYAASQGIAPDEAGHRVLAALVVLALEPNSMEIFPEFGDIDGLIEAAELARKRSGSKKRPRSTTARARMGSPP